MVCDEAMGILYDVNLSNTELPKTVEYRIDFYRSVQESTLIITAIFRKKGRQISHLECAVTDQRGRDIALATCTMLVTPCESKAEQWSTGR
jgi:acyl-coenzyme A thioesterase PaaI-like protein